MRSNDRRLTLVLLRLGFSAQYVGYNYIITSIELLQTGQASLQNISSTLYPLIANRYEISHFSAEHSIRTAIRSAWGYGDHRFQTKLFGDDYPSNARFFAILMTYLDTLSSKTRQKEN